MKFRSRHKHAMQFAAVTALLFAAILPVAAYVSRNVEPTVATVSGE